MGKIIIICVAILLAVTGFVSTQYMPSHTRNNVKALNKVTPERISYFTDTCRNSTSRDLQRLMDTKHVSLEGVCNCMAVTSAREVKPAQDYGFALTYHETSRGYDRVVRDGLSREAAKDIFLSQMEKYAKEHDISLQDITSHTILSGEIFNKCTLSELEKTYPTQLRGTHS